MAATTLNINRLELAEMIERAVEEKLLELLGDPDENLVLRESLHTRLQRQKQAVAEGQRGAAYEPAIRKRGLR